MWRIEFNDVAQKDLLSFDKAVRTRILNFFSERIAQHPDPMAVGEPLQGEFRGLHRFRIGDYRAVCHIRKKTLSVLVLFLDHRSIIYERRSLPRDFDWNEEKES